MKQINAYKYCSLLLLFLNILACGQGDMALLSGEDDEKEPPTHPLGLVSSNVVPESVPPSPVVSSTPVSGGSSGTGVPARLAKKPKDDKKWLAKVKGLEGELATIKTLRDFGEDTKDLGLDKELLDKVEKAKKEAPAGRDTTSLDAILKELIPYTSGPSPDGELRVATLDTAGVDWKKLELNMPVTAGLMCDLEDTNPIINALKIEFPKANVFNPFKDHKWTLEKTAEERAGLVLGNIFDKISNGNPNILIGVSQGGRTNLELFKLMQEMGYDISGFVTVATPWGGVPAVDIPEDVKNMLLLAKSTIPALSLLEHVNDPGVAELSPNKKVEEDVKLLPSTLCIQATMGHAFSRLKEIPFVGNFIKQHLAGGKEDTDVLIPTDNQAPVGNYEHVKKVLMKDRAHVPIFGVPSVFRCERTHQEIVKWIKKETIKRLREKESTESKKQ